MANSSFDIGDVVFLRGCYEELLDKSRELHMSPNPLELVDWMYSRGLDEILESYNISSSLLHHAARDGASALSRASVEINMAIDNNIKISPIPGPSSFVASLIVSGLPTSSFYFVGFPPKKLSRYLGLFPPSFEFLYLLQ